MRTLENKPNLRVLGKDWAKIEDIFDSMSDSFGEGEYRLARKQLNEAKKISLRTYRACDDLQWYENALAASMRDLEDDLGEALDHSGPLRNFRFRAAGRGASVVASKYSAKRPTLPNLGFLAKWIDKLEVVLTQGFDAFDDNDIEIALDKFQEAESIREKRTRRLTETVLGYQDWITTEISSLDRELKERISER